MVDWQNLQKDIAVTFHDLSLLQQTFVHSSYTNENQSFPLQDNERLEFLGDALLNFIVTEKLCQEFPNLSEGELTEIRTWLIRQETLAELASILKLGDYLYLGKGEESTGGRQRKTNLADVLEALIGAIFLDQGLSKTRDFILNKLNNKFEIIKTRGIRPNYKALLQEFTQANYKQVPTYHLLEVTGPDHNKNFTVNVTLEEKVLGIGSGKSKRAAEVEAARSAWEKLMKK